MTVPGKRTKKTTETKKWDFTSWARDNALTIVSIALAVVSFVYAWYWREQSIRIREPVLVADPTRVSILRSEGIADAPIIVTKAATGERIEADLTLVKFYLWNNGKEPIRKEHVLEPLTVKLEGQRGEILDYEIVARSRDVTEVVLSGDPDDPQRLLLIDFKILEHMDYATFQVLYQGDPNASLGVSGIVVGAAEILTKLPVDSWTFYSEALKKPAIVVIVLIVPLVGLALLARLYYGTEEKYPRFAKGVEILLNVLGTILVVGVIVVFIWAVVTYPGRVQEEIDQNPMRFLPQEIPR